jgi:1-aminocyclopropane-1-carboxylate synthase
LFRFDRDLRWRTGVNFVPVHCDSSNGFQVTVPALEAAYERAAAAGMRVAGVLLTNPSNLLGTTVTRSVLEDVLDLVARKNIHIISDEIYSSSVFAAPDLVSVAELVACTSCTACPRTWASRASASGWSTRTTTPSWPRRAACPASRSCRRRRRRRSTPCSPTNISAPTATCSGSGTTNDHVVAGLARAAVPCLRSNAGLLVWMDMRGLLREATVAGELRLWDRMLREVRLNISPGSSCHCSELGWFRVCFANMSLDTLDVALARISRFMDRWNKEAATL